MRPEEILVLDRKCYHGHEAFGNAILEACSAFAIDIIGQYGWLVRTPDNVIEAYGGMMINQHPGPLDPGFPDFGGRGMYGRRVHAAVLYFFRRRESDLAREHQDFCTEAVAQRVDKEYDRGAVLKSASVQIREDDDPYTLQERVLPNEHEVQIQTLRDFAEGTVNEQQRPFRLIRKGEEALLAEAKKVGRFLFPYG